MTKKKNMVTHWFFCHRTSTEGTYHRRFGKCARFLIVRLQRKLLSSFQTKRFKCFKTRQYIFTMSLVSLIEKGRCPSTEQI